jgi:peptidylprolyl isomerase
MASARRGDVVDIAYACLLKQDGALVESATEAKPTRITVGRSEVATALDEAIVGMRPGEEKRLEATPELAYGRYRPDRTVVVRRAELPCLPALGMRLRISPEQGNSFDATITHVSQEEAVLDTNHPLAGRDVVFNVRLLRIVGPQCDV